MNLAKNLETSATFFPDRPAVSEDLSEISYAQLNDRANRVATALIRMGVRPGSWGNGNGHGHQFSAGGAHRSGAARRRR